MKKTILLFGAAALFMIQNTSCKQKPTVLTVPEGGVIDTFFGTAVADPFRWLEDANSARTQKFVTDQNAKTFGFLDKIPFRDSIKNRLTALWDFERLSAPFKEGDKYYYYKNDGLQSQSVLFSTDAPEKDGKVVLDPNTFSKDGTVSLAGTFFSKDSRYMAYAVQDGGSDWQTIKVKDMKSGKDLSDEVQWVKFSGASWLGDGFFYSRYANSDKGDKLSQKNEFHQVWFHKIGTAQSADALVYEDKQHPTRNFGAGCTDDERFTFISGSESTSGNSLMVRDNSQPNAQFVSIVNTFENDYDVIDNNGDMLLVHTNDGAPNYRLVAIDPKNPAKANWKTVVAETPNVLQGATILGGKLFCSYLKDAASMVKIHTLDGQPVGDLTLPELGTLGGFSGKRDQDEVFYSFSSYIRPTTVFKYSVASNQSTLFRQPTINGFDPAMYQTEQVFYTSKDGTKVSMFLTMKKGTQKDGKRPTLLYGYGGFNISLTPGFKLAILPLLENGGIYAVANLRGGGEYGRKWHEGGTLMNKQNVFDDFIAAGEYLIKEKYTESAKLAIEGRSNGGLLIGACITQRPDLFGVAFPGVGVLDMLRYHKFTIGWAWKTDYGIAEDSKEMFEYLHKYSPVHNCLPAKYPATMVTTADHDDRVVPAHSYKFISALQEAQQGDKPVLIRIDVRAGHGAGKPTGMVIQEETDKLAFMFANMGLKI